MKRVFPLLLACLAPFSSEAELRLKKIADTSTPVPGSAGTFRSFGNPLVAGNLVAFYATNAVGGSGIYIHATNGVITKVADTGTTVPGSGALFLGFSVPFYCIGNGAVAFVGYFQSSEGLFHWKDGVLTRLAVTGDPVPGTALTFSTFGQPDFDGDDVVVFGSSTNNYRGAFRFSGGTVQRLFDRNDFYPGTGSNLFFSSQLSAENGKVAFWASDGAAASRNAILLYSGGTLSLHVSTNDIAPGLGTNFKDFNSPPDLEHGQVGFVASLQAPRGIYLRGVDGGPVTRLADTSITPPGSFAPFSSFTTLAVAGTNRAYILANHGIQGICLSDNGAVTPVLDTTAKFGGVPVASFGLDIAPGSYADGTLTFKVRFIGNAPAEALYRAEEYPLEPVNVTELATTSTSLPGGVGNFSQFAAPVAYNDGFAFFGRGPAGQSGMYFYLNGSLSVLVNTNTPFPHRPGNFLAATPLAVTDATLLFTGFGSDNFSGLFQWQNGTIIPIVDSTAPAAGTGVYLTSFNNVFSKDGDIFFLGVSSNSYSGVFCYSGGNLTRIVDTMSATYPGTSSNLTTLRFDYSNGKYAIVARAGNNFATNGILTWTNGTLTTLVTSGFRDPANTNHLITRFNTVVADGNDVFVAADTGSMVDSFSGVTILRTTFDGVPLNAAVSYGTEFPGILDGPQGASAIILHGSDGNGTLYLSATDGMRRGLYRWSEGVVTRIIDNSQSLDGQGVSLFNATSASFTPDAAGFSTFFDQGGAGVFSVAAPEVKPSGGMWSGGTAALSGGVFTATFLGQIAQSYEIQYSTNLLSGPWLPLTNFVYSGPTLITDSNASTRQRFYRAVSP